MQFPNATQKLKLSKNTRPGRKYYASQKNQGMSRTHENPFCSYFSYATIYYNTRSGKHLTKYQYILSELAFDQNKYPQFSRDGRNINSVATVIAQVPKNTEPQKRI